MATAPREAKLATSTAFLKTAISHITQEAARAFRKAQRLDLGAPSTTFLSWIRRNSEHGTPTTLVNNAGVGQFAPVVEMAVEDWDATIATNLRGMFLVTRAFLPAMLAEGRGTIVNVASLAGRNGFAGGAAYCASKHGVLGFSKSLMLEVRQRGLRVVAVCPGSVDTPFFDKHQTPFRPNRERILTPADVAQAVLDAIAIPERAMISELDIRPTNP